MDGPGSNRAALPKNDTKPEEGGIASSVDGLTPGL
jgi:hypothetical protein